MKSRKRSQTKKLLVLAALSLLAVAAYMLVNVNFAKPKLFQYAMRLRTPKVLAMVITAFAIGGASIVFQSVINNTIVTPCLLGIFGLTGEVESLMAGFDARIEALRTFAAGKNAIVSMVTSGGFNVLGNDGLCSLIGREVGFENVGVDANIDTSTHGNEASFEFVVQKNPNYIFVMDRDAAIGTEGAKLAKEVVENELVMDTDAYKNGHIVYLAHPAVWYTAEGGISALDMMLSDLEDALLQ